ncbi:oligoendopeptidase F [Clostridium botulinum C]|uniref:Oligopeptidase F n=2 Tax=Clostridium botulinum TaxID=1491 RepID=A0A9Q4TG09_CLOBO|nr:oligoendopeptidase F [Clostridium botulinum]MCD3193739.1 oligoendopeptidase F [Clostridium botulinum C]MCD3199807.1 oligoendopeptidase F [Clostridium botulinum C]MCD3205282.1 oligoendopeptidase F [Clostridium botulinum C]MCD3207208.1 oligoendopeptidase F [Clostridium botulinum C]MCD3224610.1 oligoendopeptidase F [Clostridium botulinum C]
MTEVKRLKTRDEIKSEDKWNIEKIYSNVEEWENDFYKLKEKAKEFEKYKGKLSNPDELLGFLRLDEEVSRLGEKLLVYAFLKGDEDTSNNVNQALRTKIEMYFSELSSLSAFFVPEILSYDKKVIEDAINKLPELKVYEVMLERILKRKPHTLTTEMEEMLAAVSDNLNAPSNIFSILTNADMTFPVIKDEEGKDVELTEGNYSIFIKSKDIRVRMAAFKALFNTYKHFKNTLATSLTSSIKNFSFIAKTRKYNSSIESSLEPNDIPIEVYDNVIKTINENLDSLHRYVKIKKKLLGLDEIHMYDLYVPVIDTPKEHIEFSKAVEMVNEALKPLGDEYIKIFNNGIKDRWIDIYENKGKRKGAYSWGTYDTMPYVLLNYNYELNDVSTLAHEMGHSIHSYYSRKEQPYIYANYTLFCAEVASTVNENLLINNLIKNETDKNKKLYLINTQLEQIRTTVFRQVMFAEFEKITHEKIDNGEPLTSDDLCKIYHELNVKYFGPDMIIDEEIDMEWARIPHFYSDFYVYQYATGYSAANSFVKQILDGGEEAVEKYKGFLKAGGSDSPINILKKAGVDMTTPKPIEDTINRFNELLNMLN